jgi:hypothetical protein
MTNTVNSTMGSVGGRLSAGYAGPPSFYGWAVRDDFGEPVIGPDTISDTMRERLLRGAGEVFRCGYRDDFGGSFQDGRYLGPTDQRHRPLLDVSFPVAGSMWIDYQLGERWIRQTGAWRTRAGLASAWRARGYLLRRGKRALLHRLGRHDRNDNGDTGRTTCLICRRDLTSPVTEAVAP